MTISASIAQTREYYKSNNILRVNGTEYSVEKDLTVSITEKENQNRDFSFRKRDGKPIDGHPIIYNGTCKVVNEEKIYPTIKRILSKYGFDIYDKDVMVPYYSGNSFSMIIWFNADSRKVESICFLFVRTDGVKVSTVPIEAFDEISKEMKRMLTCIPNEIWKELIYCNAHYKIILK